MRRLLEKPPPAVDIPAPSPRPLGSWLLLASFGLLLGCHRRTAEPHIALLPKSTSTDTAKRFRSGALAQAQRFGYSVSWNAPQAEMDYPQQAALVLNAVTEPVAGIVLVPDHQLVLAAAVQRARAAGIPVVIVNAPIALPPDEYTAFVGSNDRQIGALAADRIGHLLHGTGDVGIIGVNPVLSGFNERERAFTERMHTQFPRIRLLETEYGLSDWARSTSAAKDILTRHPHLAGLFASDGFATMGTIAALRRRKGEHHVVLVGVDQEIYVMDALREGTLDGVVATDWVALGEISMRVMHAILAGQTFPQHTELPVEMITAQNTSDPRIQRYLLPQSMTPSPDR